MLTVTNDNKRFFSVLSGLSGLTSIVHLGMNKNKTGYMFALISGLSFGYACRLYKE